MQLKPDIKFSIKMHEKIIHEPCIFCTAFLVQKLQHSFIQGKSGDVIGLRKYVAELHTLFFKMPEATDQNTPAELKPAQ